MLQDKNIDENKKCKTCEFEDVCISLENKQEQFKKLRLLLDIFDRTLEAVLKNQFGIKDKQWQLAILKVEDGYSECSQWIDQQIIEE